MREGELEFPPRRCIPISHIDREKKKERGNKFKRGWVGVEGICASTCLASPSDGF